MKTKIIISIFLSFFLLQVNNTVLHAQSTPRFLDNGDNTITDNETGLMWRKGTPSPMVSPAVTWNEALEKCEELNLGGYDDWRLPTIEEWETIIDKNNQFPALVEPNPFENVIVSSPYWSLSEYTYGPDYTCDDFGCPLSAHVTLLYLGYFGHQNKNKKAFIWPVRSTITVADTSQMVAEVEEQPIVKTYEEEPETPELAAVDLLFLQPGLLSEQFQLQGIEKQKQVQIGSYIQIPIDKTSKAIIKPLERGIEIAISIYQIDQGRINIFNNNAKVFDLPVRMRTDPETGALIFYKQP